jgi:hypothetical protein
MFNSLYGERIMDYNQLKVKSYNYWDVYLHENQGYIGRVFLQLREDQGVEDFLEIQGGIRDEFFQVGQEVKKTLKGLFTPDKMNYPTMLSFFTLWTKSKPRR